jgi:hypothetical protein
VFFGLLGHVQLDVVHLKLEVLHRAAQDIVVAIFDDLEKVCEGGHLLDHDCEVLLVQIHLLLGVHVFAPVQL